MVWLGGYNLGLVAGLIAQVLGFFWVFVLFQVGLSLTFLFHDFVSLCVSFRFCCVSTYGFQCW